MVEKADKSKEPPSVPRLLGLFLLCYAGALLLTLLIVSVTSLLSGHFGWDIIGVAACAFPAGLFVLFTDDCDWGIWAGYAAYVFVIGVGLVVRRRWVLYVFVLLLLLNIAGCCRVLYGLERSDWTCRRDSPGPKPCLLASSHTRPQQERQEL